MNLPTHTAHLPLPESTFYMLRCVVAVACADNVIKEQELLFLRALVSHFKRHMIVTAEQVAQLKEDLKHHQSIDALLPHVTERGDREQLILFAGLLAQADGELHPAEEVILQKIQAHAATGRDEAQPGPPGNHPPSTPAQAMVMPAIVAGMAPKPKMDMDAFMQEVREVVRQEFYTQALATSGVAHKTGRVAVVDAFAEKSPIVPHTSAMDVLAETPKLGRTMQASLVPGERVLGKARFHWIYTFNSLTVAAVLISAARPAAHALTALSRRAGEAIVNGNAAWLGEANIEKLLHVLGSPLWATAPAFALYLLALLVFLWRFAIQMTTEIIVTDSRIVAKQGVFRVRTFKADLANLGQVDVNQSLLGNILGYGRVHIYTRNWSGQGSQVEAEGIYLPPIADPHSFSTLIDRARRMWRTRSV